MATVNLYQSICGKFKDRDAVEAAFWEIMETCNGKRKTPPRKFIKITRIVMAERNTVYFSVPSKIVNQLMKAPDDHKCPKCGGEMPEKKPIANPDCFGDINIKKLDEVCVGCALADECFEQSLLGTCSHERKVKT